MSTLRLTALAGLILLALPASAGAAKFRAVVSASQVTTWSMARQLDSNG